MAVFKRYKSIIFSTLITFVFLVVVMIIKKIEPFGNMTLVNYDCQSQVYPFLCTLHDKLVNGENFFYAWNAGLGDGYLPTYFYYLSSPFNLLVAFVDKSNIRSFINITIFLRLTLAATNMSIYLSSRYNSDEQLDVETKKVYILPISVAYALSNFVFGFYHESMWLDSYMIFPLVMFGYDRMVRDKKPLVYILCLVYSSFCSFYMTFIIGVFLVLWFLLDKHDIQDGKSRIKSFLSKALLFGVSSALAIGMTAMSLLVSYIGVMKTHVQAEPEIVHEWFGNFFNIFRYQFPFSTPINVSYNNNCANIYCGVFAVGFVFVYIFTGKIKLADRIKRIALIIFIVLSFNEAILNFIWHGFHYQLCIPNRFAFLLIFLVLVTAYDTLIYADNIKYTAIGLVFAEAFPMLSYFFVDFDSLIGSKTELIVSLILILIYSAMIILHIGLKKIIIFYIFAILMSCEILSNAYMTISYDLSEAGRFDEVLSISQNYAVGYKEQDEPSFCRSKLLGTILKNTECLIGTNGMSIFNSMIGSEVLDFSENYGYFKTDVAIDENGGFEPIDDIIGSKYIYAVKESFLDSTDYELIDTSGDVKVYKNPNALSLGYAVNKDIEKITSDKNEVVQNVNQLTSAMTGCGEIMNEVIPEYKVSGEGYAVQYSNEEYLYMRITPNGQTEYPYVQISFNIPEDSLYNIYLNYADYGIISVYVNNELRRYEYTSFGGILNLGKLSKNDKIDILIQSENRMADGYAVTNTPTIELRLEKINDNEYDSFINYLKKGKMHISKFSENKISADVSLSDNQMLFTSIPYDESWHVYENGKEIEKKKLVGAFLGFDLGAGKHELEFKYIPEGFYVGMVITIVSWILFIVWLIIVNTFFAEKSINKDKNEKSNINMNNETENEIING